MAKKKHFWVSRVKSCRFGTELPCRRNIKEHSFQASGDAIKLETEKVSRSYMVNIAQRVFVEEDPEESCRDYPNEEFLSYQHCDDQFVRSRLNGLTPVWLTEDFAEVSTQSFDDGGLYGELFFWENVTRERNYPDIKILSSLFRLWLSVFCLHSVQMSEGSQVSKVDLCVKIKWMS